MWVATRRMGYEAADLNNSSSARQDLKEVERIHSFESLLSMLLITLLKPPACVAHTRPPGSSLPDRGQSAKGVGWQFSTRGVEELIDFGERFDSTGRRDEEEGGSCVVLGLGSERGRGEVLEPFGETKTVKRGRWLKALISTEGKVLRGDSRCRRSGVTS